MAFSLRLPPALEADARARCERLGISLNALVCVALDAYLRAPSQSAVQHPAEGREAAGAGLVSVSTTCTTPIEVPAACVAAPVPEPVPAPAPAPVVPSQKPVLTAPPLAALVPPSVAVAPALSRVERRRLERASKKR